MDASLEPLPWLLLLLPVDGQFRLSPYFFDFAFLSILKICQVPFGICFVSSGVR